MKINSTIPASVILMSIAGLSHGGGNPHADRALSQLKSHGHQVAQADGDVFSAAAVLVDEKGGSHVRFERSFKGLRVLGGDFIVHQDSKGLFKSATHTLKAPLNVKTAARVDEWDATINAEGFFDGQRNGNGRAELMVWARGEQPRLAYDVRVQGSNSFGVESDMHFIIDAENGSLLEKWDDVHTASAVGTGKSLYLGNVAITTDLVSGTYNMRDPSRGNGYTNDAKNRTNGSGTIFTDADNIWGNNTSSDRASAAADAHYGVATTWDYFLNKHSRNGIANDGKGALSKVHVGRKWVNASWSDACFCMSYGDGDGVSYGPLVTLDIAGHEMTHGVTSRSAKLVYSGESGGLNESTSDIFGMMVEFYANNSNDTPDWKMGEEIYLKYPDGSKALRYAYKPSLDGASPDCYYSGIGSLDVHYSSGIGNRFFYFLSEGNTSLSGATCNASNVSGIGKDKAAAIWYKALTAYMTSSTNYPAARTATLNAARDLYGLNSAEYNAVAAAWSAVSVN